MDRQDPGSITELQTVRLKQMLGQETPTDHLSFAEAERLLKFHDPDASWRTEPASSRQWAFLKHRGLWREGMSRGEASALIGEALRKERTPGRPVGVAVLSSPIHGQRAEGGLSRPRDFACTGPRGRVS
jgi:hypothetical protein